MPKTPNHLPSGVRTTDILTVTQFASIFPLTAVAETLEKHQCETLRVRLLPSEFIIYFVMMLAIFRDCNHREVYRCVASALNRLIGLHSESEVPSASALSRARARVKDKPFEELFHKFAVPAASENAKGSFFKQWRKVIIDGTLINTEDSPTNRKEFGCATNQNKTVAKSPQVRVVTLMEAGTHLMFRAAMGPYFAGEIALARSLFKFLRPDMICLLDRNFFSFETFRAISDTGAAALFRVQRGMTFQPQHQLSDNSFLVTIYHSEDTKKKNGITARFFQYKVIDGNKKETFYMMTTILDPADATADELAALYHERWETESTYDELKTHLGAKYIVLRSKTPELVKQELWGLLMAHYVIRKTMNLAAEKEKLDPDKLSFTHSTKTIKRALMLKPSAFSPSA